MIKMEWLTKVLTGMVCLAILAGCSTGAGVPKSSSADLESQARQMIDQMAAGQFNEARQNFDGTMKLALPEEKLKETWTALIQQAGAFDRQGDSRQETEGKYQIVYVTCRFALSALDVRVVFNNKGKISGLFFQPAKDTSAMAPEYQSPVYANLASFHEEEITVGSGVWQLPGTITLPNSGGPFPAVVLVHGSGPNDRDETIGPNRPFKDLAWGLASQGIIVLRYDKRTKVHADQFTPEVLATMTVQDEVISDALAAVTLLRSRAEVDGRRIYVLGHSLGATLAPRIGEQEPDLAGLVLLAGAARPIEDLMMEQSTYLAQADGKIDKQESNQLAALRKLVDQIKELPKKPDADPNEVILGANPAYWRDLDAYQPVQTAEKLSLPMLILQGERDYQVTMTDYSAWQQALGSRSTVTLKTYPALNHLFIAGTGPSLPAEYQITGHVDQAVINDISSWIKQ